MRRAREVLACRHTVPVGLLLALCVLYWSPILLTGRVLLPGAMLSGFAPFGDRADADWNILQWDALAQYFPWRAFAARELQSGHIPLWNPHQFSGAPFLANGQSAIFYSPNLVFWIFDTAFTFGISAFLHTVLAGLSTYFLATRWKFSRAASLLSAIAFAFCGYLAAWVMLPTLANTASWLPGCLLLFECAASPDKDTERQGDRKKHVLIFLPLCLPVSLSLTCALLAGHAQIFFYILVALFLRALFLPRPLRALSTLAASFASSLMLSALQLLPTLELARNGHRAGTKPSAVGWQFLQTRALQLSDFPALVIPNWPQLSMSENFGYIGTGVLALSACAIAALCLGNSKSKIQNSKFPLALTAFGILYATATPLSQAFYYGVPGLSQMGGVGRALVLWSLGVALLAGFGLDMLRQRWSTPIIPAIALIVVCGELFLSGNAAHPSAPRNTIYPETRVTQFLQSNTTDGARILFLTPRASWLPAEAFRQGERAHPSGVLPPNGAMVYGLNDVNGYDSLAPRAYREFVASGENLQPGEDVAPALNGNMILLNNPNSPLLDTLNVRYVVSQNPLDATRLGEVLRADGCIVYERKIQNTPRRDGRDFSPGWREGQYQPESFRFGLFVSLCALAVSVALFVGTRRVR
jgi:hypothetical protein